MSHPTPATACDYTSVLARPTLSVVFQEREKKKFFPLVTGGAHQVMPLMPLVPAEI